MAVISGDSALQQHFSSLQLSYNLMQQLTIAFIYTHQYSQENA